MTTEHDPFATSTFTLFFDADGNPVDAPAPGDPHDHDPGHWDAVAHRNPIGCPCCAANDAVAPFVNWLADGDGLDLEARLLGQALATTALEQLGAHDLASAKWGRLDVRRCMVECARACLPEPRPGELRTTAKRLVAFVVQCGLLPRRQGRDLVRRIRMARIASSPG